MNAPALVDVRPTLLAKFEKLAALENGWYNGSGLAPDKAQLAVVARQFSERYSATATPLIVATPEGNLLFEWDLRGSPSVNLEIASLTAEFHVFAPDQNDFEREFSLETQKDWDGFFAFLDGYLNENG